MVSGYILHNCGVTETAANTKNCCIIKNVEPWCKQLFFLSELRQTSSFVLKPDLNVLLQVCMKENNFFQNFLKEIEFIESLWWL